MQISTSLNIIYGRNGAPCDSDWIGKIAAAGYDGLDFNFLDIEEDVDWFNEYEADKFIEQLALVAATNNLTWFQGHAPIYNFFINEPVINRKHALCEPAIRAAAYLKVPWLVFHPSEFINYNPATQRHAVMEKNIEHFQEMLKLCEKYNVGMALENMPSDYQGVTHFAINAEELCELTDRLNHPLVGNCWDTGHAKINNLDQQKELITLGSRLKVLHLQDNDGNGDDHLLPYTRGVNGIDWASVVAGLKAVSYSGTLNLEAHSSFQNVPDELLFDTIKYSAKILKSLS